MYAFYSSVSRSLSGRMLGHALAIMRPVAQEMADASYVERWQAIQRNYQLMADYFMQGHDDVQRGEVLDSLVRDAYGLLDALYLAKRKAESTDYEFREMLREQTGSADAAEAFRYIWLGELDEEHLARYQELIADPAMLDEGLMVVSAMMLHVLRSFSEEGVLALMQAADERNEEDIRERAWIGVLLVLLEYDERMRFYPEIMSELQDLLSSEDGIAFAVTAMSAIVRTLGVEWASGAFKNLQKKLVPIFRDPINDAAVKGTLTQEDIDDFAKEMESEFAEVWEEQSREIGKIKEEFLDEQFALMRNMYATSFFAEPYRWWLPFSDYYLPEKLNDNPLLQKLLPLMDMCDSDKYAMITSLQKIELMNAQSMGSSELPELPTESVLPHLLCNDYMRQVYRFFKLNPWQIASPLDGLPRLGQTQLFKLLYASAREKKNVGNQMMRCHAYDAARVVYEQIAESVDDADVWKNWGFCCQKQGLYAEALEKYENALVVYKREAGASVPEHLLSVMAYCQEQLGQYDSALLVCNQLVAQHPDNQQYTYRKCQCLEHLQLYAEALPLYYKLDLQTPGRAQVRRSIAWCSMQCDDWEAAHKYFLQLTKDGQDVLVDWLREGHLLFVEGNRQKAFQLYLKTMMQSDSLKAFLQLFRPDRAFLVEKGVEKADIYLMEDQLISTHAQM